MFQHTLNHDSHTLVPDLYIFHENFQINILYVKHTVFLQAASGRAERYSNIGIGHKNICVENTPQGFFFHAEYGELGVFLALGTTKTSAELELFVMKLLADVAWPRSCEAQFRPINPLPCEQQGGVQTQRDKRGQRM